MKHLSFRGLAILIFFTGSCSVPNLESSECAAARIVVREFYSFHFGNEMKFSQQNLAARKRFLTSELFESLASAQSEGDVFTIGSDDVPKAFRVGACEEQSPARVSLDVLLFWRDDVRSEQRQIKAEVVRQGETWLVNSIFVP